MNARLATRLLATVAALSLATMALAEDKKPADKKPAEKKAAEKKAPEKPAEKPAAAVSSAVAAPAGVPADAPKIVVPESIKDYGTVPKGEELVWTFEIRNEGKSDLIIDSVKPACGCTLAGDFDKTIKPGGKGKIPLKVETKNFAGPISKSATVASNDPANPSMNLVIKAIVKPYVEVLPQQYVRFSGLQGEGSTQSVTLLTEEKTPFKVDRVESQKPFLKATVTPVADKDKVQGKGDNAQYKIDITLEKDAPVGLLNEKVIAHTNLEKSPMVEITVSGLVRPIVSVTPQSLNFGTITSGSEPTTRNVIVANNKEEKKDFKVVKAELLTVPAETDKAAKPTAYKGIATEISPIQEGVRYQVVLKTDKDIAKGPINAKLKITTNDPKNPTFDVDVKGEVQ